MWVLRDDRWCMGLFGECCRGRGADHITLSNDICDECESARVGQSGNILIIACNVNFGLLSGTQPGRSI